eukprot:m.84913 g.84913  ORF g.84913 m.84913 type:complete len:435 (-) comp12174_c1_seq1:81-1385(-)
MLKLLAAQAMMRVGYSMRRLCYDSIRTTVSPDVVEFQVHGGNAVVRSVLNALEMVDGLRHAEPGEFTRRAFWNGRLDLTQAEGLSQLIMADTEEQRKLAVSHVGGSSSRLCLAWRTRLTSAVAKMEAYIDFSEDENIEDGVLHEVRNEMIALGVEIEGQLRASVSGERISQGLKTAITGLPDVGKSTLLNILCDRDAAIVSSGPGTTRDVLQVNADIGGYPVVLYDTAGIRHGEDVGEVEKEGVRRAHATAAMADLRICVHDASSPPAWCSSIVHKCGVVADGGDQPEGDSNGCSCSQREGRTIQVVNKIDCVDEQTRTKWKEHCNGSGIHFVSFATKEGMDILQHDISTHVKELCSEGLQSSGGEVLVTKERHRAHLKDCAAHLHNAMKLLDVDVVLCAQNLRFALEDIGKITGAVHFEDIMDEVFSQFCIGK